MAIRVTWYDKDKVQEFFHAANSHEIVEGVLALYRSDTGGDLVALFDAGQWHHFEVIYESDAAKEPPREQAGKIVEAFSEAAKGITSQL